MPTLDQITNASQQTTLDALDAAAVAIGAANLATLLGWLANTTIFSGQANFANSNASNLAAVL